MTKKESNILLFSITLCWASSYIFIKDLPEDLSSYAYLTLTSGLAGLILLVIFHRSLKKINRKTVLHGLILSGLLAGNMLLEKKGAGIYSLIDGKLSCFFKYYDCAADPFAVPQISDKE